MLYSSVNFQPSTSVDITDRGLAFGDGIFTTGKIVSGHLQFMSDHMLRLQMGCRHLNIDSVNWQNVENEIVKACKGSELACLKVIITAGQQGRGYSRQGCSRGNVLITVLPFPIHYLHWQEQGIILGESSFKLGLNPQLKGIKHLNRLEQVIIRNELDGLTTDEVVVSDINENVVECNTANLFWIKGNYVYTPSLENSGVEGIIRAKVIEKLNNVKVVSRPIDDLYHADAVFITNSLMGVVAVNQINDYRFDRELVYSIVGQF